MMTDPAKKGGCHNLQHNMQHEHTLIGSWATLVARCLDHYGFDGAQLCTECDIDLSQAADPEARFSARDMRRLWKTAVQYTGDPAFGLRAGCHISPSTFRALTVSMWMSRTLKEAFERLVLYAPMSATTGQAELRETADSFKIVIRLERQPNGKLYASHEAADALLAGCVTFCRQLQHPSFKPLKIQMIRPAPDNFGPYHNVFGCPVEFGCEDIVMVFPKTPMLEALPSADSEMARQADKMIVNYLQRMQQDDIVSRVEVLLRELLPKGPITRKEVAAHLNMSLRKLQLKLQGRDTSYQEILEKLRHQLAKQYLHQSRLPVGDISFKLGFASAASFSRAFRRWTGLSPAGYRDRRFDHPENPSH